MIACARAIAEEVALRCDATWQEVVGDGRSTWACRARVHIVGVLRDTLGMSFPEIARVMHRVCHSSAHSMYRTRWLKVSKEARDDFVRSLETVKAHERRRATISNPHYGAGGSGIQRETPEREADEGSSRLLHGEAGVEEDQSLAHRKHKRSVIWESMANHRA